MHELSPSRGLILVNLREQHRIGGIALIDRATVAHDFFRGPFLAIQRVRLRQKVINIHGALLVHRDKSHRVSARPKVQKEKRKQYQKFLAEIELVMPLRPLLPASTRVCRFTTFDRPARARRVKRGWTCDNSGVVGFWFSYFPAYVCDDA
jgi:hypothetical protein